MTNTITPTKVKITATQEAVNCITVTHTTEGSEAQLVFTLIATNDGFTVSGKSVFQKHTAKCDVAAYATSDGDLALVMI